MSVTSSVHTSYTWCSAMSPASSALETALSNHSLTDVDYETSSELMSPRAEPRGLGASRSSSALAEEEEAAVAGRQLAARPAKSDSHMSQQSKAICEFMAECVVPSESPGPSISQTKLRIMETLSQLTSDRLFQGGSAAARAPDLAPAQAPSPSPGPPRGAGPPRPLRAHLGRNRAFHSMLRIEHELQPLNLMLSRLLAEFRAMDLRGKLQRLDSAVFNLRYMSSDRLVQRLNKPASWCSSRSAGCLALGARSSAPTYTDLSRFQQRLVRATKPLGSRSCLDTCASAAARSPFRVKCGGMSLRCCHRNCCSLSAVHRSNEGPEGAAQLRARPTSLADCSCSANPAAELGEAAAQGSRGLCKWRTRPRARYYRGAASAQSDAFIPATDAPTYS